MASFDAYKHQSFLHCTLQLRIVHVLVGLSFPPTCPLKTPDPWVPNSLYLDIPECIVTLLLSWSRGRAEVQETVDGVSDGTTGSCKLVHDVGGIGVGREGLGRQEKLGGGDRDGSQVPQHRVPALRVLGMEEQNGLLTVRHVFMNR